MAFCPNCGTPNTDQAEKCVSCNFDMQPKQKAKFKGTIMMSGVQAPVAGRPPQAGPGGVLPEARDPAPAPAPSSQPAGGTSGKNLAFEKTIMGPMAPVPGHPMPGQSMASPRTADAQQDFARAATLEGPAPLSQASAAQPASTPAGGFGASATTGDVGASRGGFGNTGSFGGADFGDSMAPPAPPKSNTGKYLAIGCAAVLILACVIGGLLFFVAREKLNAMFGAMEQEGDALEWRGSLAQSLSQVSALCQSDCQSAAVYFHPQVQGSLVAEAKQLTAARVQKLMDPTQSEARMLDATDDAAIAQNLSLDPQQCVRIVAGTAKVVGCSVPDPSGGTASLRIVRLSGIGAL